MNCEFVSMSKYIRPQNCCCVPKKTEKKRITEKKDEPVTSVEKDKSFQSIHSEEEEDEELKSIPSIDADRQRPLVVVVVVNGRNMTAGRKNNENDARVICMCKNEIKSCDCSLQEEDFQGANSGNTYDYTGVNQKSVNGNRPDYTENFRRLEELICKCAKTQPNSTRNFEINQMKKKINEYSRSSSHESSQSKSSDAGNSRRICKAYSDKPKTSQKKRIDAYDADDDNMDEENEDLMSNCMEYRVTNCRDVRTSFNGNNDQKDNCNGMTKISCPICAATGFQRVEVPICVAKDGCPHCRRLEMETATAAVTKAITNIKNGNKNVSNDGMCCKENNEQVCCINAKCLDYCTCMHKSMTKNSKKKKKSSKKRKINNGLVDRLAPISLPLRDIPKKVVKSEYNRICKAFSQSGLHCKKEKAQVPPVILRDLPKDFVQSEECSIPQNCCYYIPACNGCYHGCRRMW